MVPVHCGDPICVTLQVHICPLRGISLLKERSGKCAPKYLHGLTRTVVLACFYILFNVFIHVFHFFNHLNVFYILNFLFIYFFLDYGKGVLKLLKISAPPFC